MADKNGKHPCADPSCPGVLCGPGGALDYPGEQVTESAEVRVGFRYQDGEVLTPAREALSEDDEIPTVVIDLGDGEWLTLAELRDLHSEGGDS